MRSILRNLASRGGSAAAGAQPPSPAPSVDASDRLAMLEEIEQAGLGWFWATDAEGRLTYLSPSARALFGEEREITSCPMVELVQVVSEDDGDACDRPLSFLLRARSSFADLPVRLLREAEQETWWALSGKPRYGEGGSFLGFRGSAKDISASFEKQRDSSRMAQFDALTGLANRSRMERRLAKVLEATRRLGRPCALLMMDLDRFKQVNDTFGHPVGDELLRQVAQRIQRIVPDSAEIGRLGGDEFQVIIPDQANKEALQELSLRLIQMISQPYAIDNCRAEIGSSIGIALAPTDGSEPDEIVKRADIALYAAKDAGRGQVRFYSRDLVKSTRDRDALELDLRSALTLEQMALHYQPMVEAQGHRVVAFEALMRWDHPERGMVPPATFIPIAEESDLICDLGEWSLRRACRDAGEWPENVRVAVNVSAKHFAARGFADMLGDVLDETGLKAARLELELTEAALHCDETVRSAVFAQLKRLGVRLVLDDFGTGESSLGALRNGPFERVKIDQQFVSGCAEPGSQTTAVFSAIATLSHALGLKTTAEGVEVLDELNAVEGLGADLVQGFIFARPMPQVEVLERFARGDARFEPSGPRHHRAERRSVFRRIGVVHENYRYTAVMRNVSRTGALIEGLLEVPVGTQLVLDLGEGQLAVATVRRSQDATQGVEFETPLVYDNANRLCTRHRVSPRDLVAAGLDRVWKGAETGDDDDGARPHPRFMEVDVSAASSRAA